MAQMVPQRRVRRAGGAGRWIAEAGARANSRAFQTVMMLLRVVSTHPKTMRGAQSSESDQDETPRCHIPISLRRPLESLHPAPLDDTLGASKTPRQSDSRD